MFKSTLGPPFTAVESTPMAATQSLRPDDRYTSTDDDAGAHSDVFAVRAVRPEPSPAAFAIHDAKNMAGVLSANLEVLRRALADRPMPRGAADALADMEEATRRLGGLLREALTELQGREPLRRAPRSLRVAPIVTAAVDQMRPAARARGVRIAETGVEDVHATIEPDLFERVIVNLLENAVRFSHPGDTVEIECDNRSGRLTLAVGDRGPGVPESAREQIFESFRRNEAGTEGSHFGLGLAFCREVARAHGGDAWMFNRARGGACFVFEIE